MVKIVDLEKKDPILASWLLTGLRAIGLRRLVVILDTEKPIAKSMQWSLTTATNGNDDDKE